MPFEVIHDSLSALPEFWQLDFDGIKSQMGVNPALDYWSQIPGKLYWDGSVLSYFSESMKDLGLKPLSFDFNYLWRIAQAEQKSKRRGPFFKALGKAKMVVDGTCGSGKDSTLMAGWGIKVAAFERSPYIFLLLKDGLRRAPPAFRDRFELAWGDGLQMRTQVRTGPGLPIEATVLYYDPMYPQAERARKQKKGAKACKEMEVFREIAYCDTSNETDLFTQILLQPWHRIIVKRPPKSKIILIDSLPRTESYYWEVTSFAGKAVRYDRYSRILKKEFH